MATSTVAMGKLVIATRWGKPIPPGWALDDQGQPTTDPTVAIKNRLLSPLGGSWPALWIFRCVMPVGSARLP